MTGIRALVPGLVLLVAVGAAARLIGLALPGTTPLILAVFLGILLGNTVGVPGWARSGVETHKLLLEAGIVVMGAGVALGRVVSAGPKLLSLVVATVATTVLVVETVARFVLAIQEETGSLLAAGSGICGVSAVVVVAESIDVTGARVAYAAATVLLFDAVTVFLYPVVGHLLGLSDPVFGIWAGLTMFSTGPVAAAGFAFSETAGEWAVLVKLVRNSLIGVAAVAYALYYASRRSRDVDADAVVGPQFLWDTFPKFVLGFFGVMLVANAGILDAGGIKSLTNAADWAFLFAFAGLGLSLDLAELRATGYRPVLVVLLAMLLVASTMLVVVGALF